MQILPATFARFARPGEDINNPADNQAVGRRILATYYDKYNGDAGRIAVAYFSGEGNVAPPGSPTAWKEDRKDGNGKSVSSYVGDILAHTARAGSEVDRSQARRRMLETDPALANDPATRDQALANLAHRESVDAADQAKRERDAREQLYTATTAGVDPWTTDPATRAMVGPEYMAQMQAMHAKAGKVEMNYIIEDKLHRMVMDNPELFASGQGEADLSRYLGQTSPERMQYWMGQQRQMASAENRAALRQPSYATAERIAGELFPHSAKDKAAAEDNPTDAANPYNRNVNARQALRSWIDQYVAENKKPPSTDEITRTARSMQLRKDKVWSPGQRIDAMTTGKADTFELDTGSRNHPLIAQATGIPVGDLPAVIAYAKAKGQKPTMETLIMLARAGGNQSPPTVK